MPTQKAKPPRLYAALWVLLAATSAWMGCASTPAYQTADCPLYTELGPLSANPAGDLKGRVSLEVAFRVCPPEAGLAELKRKRIELKHEVLALVSARDAAFLKHPRRIENLRTDLLRMANDKIMRKGRVEDVLVTNFQYQE